MQFCGIICEFNPFHNGHKYLINQAKKLTNEPVVCLMSGDFVQRGEPAIQDKYTRAKNAIISGSDAVLELPTVFAFSNAENFAYGAVRIFDSLNATHLAFGVENTSLETLQKIAEIKCQNKQSFQNNFKNEIENGINYNTALKRAIAKEFGGEKILKILAKPNNILAIEYLTALKELNSKIQPVAIERADNGYNSLDAKNEFLSASGIREKIKNDEDISKYVPDNTISENWLKSSNQEKFDTLAIYNLRNTPEKLLGKCYDYTEGIEYRVKKIADSYSTLEEISQSVSTPRYRLARVKKLLIYPLLNITKKSETEARLIKPAVKILAINKKFKQFLSETNKKKISLIVTNKDYENLSSKQKNIVNIDLAASNIYSLVTGKENNNDKKTGVLFL